MTARRPILLAALSALTLAACKPLPTYKAGMEAPPLKIDRILDAPAGSIASWDDPVLKGRPVVLEFWATWCGPCTEAIPHMNRLEEHLKDRIVFISVTDEDEEPVLEFLKSEPMEGWNAFDPDGALFDAFGIRQRPATIVVGADRRIAAVTHPLALDEEMLEDVLAGKTVDPGELTDGDAVAAMLESEDDEGGQGFLLRIRPHNPEARTMYVNETSFKRSSETLRELLGFAYGVREEFIGSEVPLDDERYDLVIHMPDTGGAEMKRLLRSALSAHFSLQVSAVKRSTEGYALRSMPRRKLKKPADTSFSRHLAMGPSSRKFAMENGDLGALIWALEGFVLMKPIVDETGLKGDYDYEVAWPSDEEADVLRAVEEQLGLRLVPGRVEVDALQVRPRPPESP